MANKKNKVKFGLQNVYWAKINEWGEDPDGNKTVPAYGPSKHLPGAVSLSIDANGEAENFYADNGVYYVINNNAGYTGDLEIALITTEFATEILGEILDNNGVLVEKNDTELAQFALMFEFLGDKHHIMAKHADPENVPDNPDEFLEQFNTFSIYEILPQLIELWGLNTTTQVESKKNIARLTAR